MKAHICPWCGELDDLGNDEFQVQRCLCHRLPTACTCQGCNFGRNLERRKKPTRARRRPQRGIAA